MASTLSTPTNARFLIQTMKGPRELKLIRERGDWAVASFDFRDNGPVTGPAAAGTGSGQGATGNGLASGTPLAEVGRRILDSGRIVPTRTAMGNWVG